MSSVRKKCPFKQDIRQLLRWAQPCSLQLLNSKPTYQSYVCRREPLFRCMHIALYISFTEMEDTLTSLQRRRHRNRYTCVFNGRAFSMLPVNAELAKVRRDPSPLAGNLPFHPKPNDEADGQDILERCDVAMCCVRQNGNRIDKPSDWLAIA